MSSPSPADWRLLAGYPLPRAGTDLSISSSLGPDLPYIGRAILHDGWWDEWTARRCPVDACPSYGTCPWSDWSGEAAETVNVFIVRLLWRFGCLGPSRFVGRSANTGTYRAFLDGVDVPASSRLRRHLAALGTRGRLIGWIPGNSDGVHGWLEPGETVDLADDRRPAPGRHRADARRCRRLGRGPGPYDEFSYERWSLAVVRAMCTVAREAGMGVLWANDLLFDADDADVP